jgi:hypothetical protein
MIFYLGKQTDLDLRMIWGNAMTNKPEGHGESLVHIDLGLW